MAPNRGEDDEYPSSDNDSFKSFDSDSRTSVKDHKTTPQTQSSSTSAAPSRSADEKETEQSNSSSTPSTSTPKSKPSGTSPSKPDSKEPIPLHPQSERFPPEEEASLLAESNAEKTTANTLFGTGSYENAVQTYDRALALCPNYLDYEIAVLRSNIAACHLKLGEWKQSADAASKGIDCLERLERLPVVRAPERRGKEGKDGVMKEDEKGAGEVVEEVDEDLEARIENLRLSGHTIAQVRKLQVKMLMRRAKAKTELDGWANLQAADEDYRVLLSPTMEPALAPTDKRSVLESARALGPRLNKAKEQEMAEMMGKLKGLGNSFLKPFGLSTENFKFEQDAKTGGYSMNFDQGARKK
jgi:tetratricopeptide (TPR) repeat protein